MPQKYWGVTVIGCLWILTCALLTLFGGVLTFLDLPPDAAAQAPPTPVAPRTVGIVLLCMAACSAVLTRGFFRLKFWAWDGTVFTAICFCLGAFLQPWIGKDVGPGGFLVFAIGGALMAIPAVLILRYMLQEKIRALFQPDPQSKTAAIAMPVRLVAFAAVLGGGAAAGGLMTDTEIPLFGLVLTGAAGRAYSLAMAAVNLYCGIGLYRANDLARRVAIGLQAVGLLYVLSIPFGKWASQSPVPAALAGIVAAGCMFEVLLIWVLVTRRQGFTRS